jgi:hypothetical protein
MKAHAHHLTERAAGALLAAALLASAPFPALAGPACTGTFSTSSLQPIKMPATIALANAPENPSLANPFLDGLKAAGVTIDPASPLRLDLVFTLATPASGSLQGAVYNNLTWADEGGGSVDVNASRIDLMAHLVNTSNYSYVWIATAQCTVKVQGGGAVANELGRFIGRTIGKDVPDGKL